ncbi:ribosomal protein S15 [Datura stramonium]|uniref:Ribosomal protein S15 n=1 Tax=Datura stramonium TaxID=4076 RepID=A0ABS8VG02_DATST|nr:ribosomal protein S15 [Datura stramonium]
MWISSWVEQGITLADLLLEFSSGWLLASVDALYFLSPHISIGMTVSLIYLNIEAPPGEKPEPVKTHLRNMIIVPEMIGSVIGIYNGKTFNQIESKPEMIGHYLAEFSISLTSL